MGLIGGDKGWVITTSPSFTASAKAFAQKSDVKLIDGKMLKMGSSITNLRRISFCNPQ